MILYPEKFPILSKLEGLTKAEVERAIEAMSDVERISAGEESERLFGVIKAPLERVFSLLESCAMAAVTTFRRAWYTLPEDARKKIMEESDATEPEQPICPQCGRGKDLSNYVWKCDHDFHIGGKR